MTTLFNLFYISGWISLCSLSLYNYKKFLSHVSAIHFACSSLYSACICIYFLWIRYLLRAYDLQFWILTFSSGRIIAVLEKEEADFLQFWSILPFFTVAKYIGNRKERVVKRPTGRLQLQPPPAKNPKNRWNCYLPCRN